MVLSKPDLSALPPEDVLAGPQLAELSRRLVQVLRREVGRGPTQAKSFWAGDDLLIALFGDVFLRAEKTLLTHGQEDVAMAYRGAIQHALRQELRAEVRPENEAVRMMNRRFRFTEGEPFERTTETGTVTTIPISLRRENRRTRKARA